MNSPLNQVDCPNCGRSVDARAPACPSCGEKIYVEHPADMERVRHKPMEMPPAESGSYGPRSDDSPERKDVKQGRAADEGKDQTQ